jgi:acetylcholinesterase
MVIILVGDIFFIAQRRAMSQLAVAKGIKSFAYVFSDPPPPNLLPPYFGGTRTYFTAPTWIDVPAKVYHGLDSDYLFDKLQFENATASALHLAEVVIDYWVSFITSLDPNDGKGTQREYLGHICAANSTHSVLQVRIGPSTAHKPRFAPCLKLLLMN